MKESTKNNFLLPLMVAFIVAFVLSPIANAFFDPKKKEIPFITPVLKFFSFIWNSILNYPLPIWIFLVVMFLIGFLLYFINIKKKTPIEDIQITVPPPVLEVPVLLKPDYLKYTQDILKQWKWNWKYKTTDYGKTYLIDDLRPVCSNCSMKAIDGGLHFLFTCPNCDRVFNTAQTSSEDKNKIIALIKYRIENKLY
jgi:hypothetical protein